MLTSTIPRRVKARPGLDFTSQPSPLTIHTLPPSLPSLQPKPISTDPTSDVTSNSLTVFSEDPTIDVDKTDPLSGPSPCSISTSTFNLLPAFDQETSDLLRNPTETTKSLNLDMILNDVREVPPVIHTPSSITRVKENTRSEAGMDVKSENNNTILVETAPETNTHDTVATEVIEAGTERRMHPKMISALTPSQNLIPALRTTGTSLNNSVPASQSNSHSASRGQSPTHSPVPSRVPSTRPSPCLPTSSLPTSTLLISPSIPKINTITNRLTLQPIPGLVPSRHEALTYSPVSSHAHTAYQSLIHTHPDHSSPQEASTSTSSRTFVRTPLLHRVTHPPSSTCGLTKPPPVLTPAERDQVAFDACQASATEGSVNVSNGGPMPVSTVATATGTAIGTATASASTCLPLKFSARSASINNITLGTPSSTSPAGSTLGMSGITTTQVPTIGLRKFPSTPAPYGTPSQMGQVQNLAHSHPQGQTHQVDAQAQTQAQAQGQGYPTKVLASPPTQVYAQIDQGHIQHTQGLGQTTQKQPLVHFAQTMEPSSHAPHIQATQVPVTQIQTQYGQAQNLASVHGKMADYFPPAISPRSKSRFKSSSPGIEVGVIPNHNKSANTQGHGKSAQTLPMLSQQLSPLLSSTSGSPAKQNHSLSMAASDVDKQSPKHPPRAQLQKQQQHHHHHYHYQARDSPQNHHLASQLVHDRKSASISLVAPVSSSPMIQSVQSGLTPRLESNKITEAGKYLSVALEMGDEEGRGQRKIGVKRRASEMGLVWHGVRRYEMIRQFEEDGHVRLERRLQERAQALASVQHASVHQALQNLLCSEPRTIPVRLFAQLSFAVLTTPVPLTSRITVRGASRGSGVNLNWVDGDGNPWDEDVLLWIDVLLVLLRGVPAIPRSSIMYRTTEKRFKAHHHYNCWDQTRAIDGNILNESDEEEETEIKANAAMTITSLASRLLIFVSHTHTYILRAIFLASVYIPIAWSGPFAAAVEFIFDRVVDELRGRHESAINGPSRVGLDGEPSAPGMGRTGGTRGGGRGKRGVAAENKQVAAAATVTENWNEIDREWWFRAKRVLMVKSKSILTLSRVYAEMKGLIQQSDPVLVDGTPRIECSEVTSDNGIRKGLGTGSRGRSFQSHSEAQSSPMILTVNTFSQGTQVRHGRSQGGRGTGRIGEVEKRCAPVFEKGHHRCVSVMWNGSIQRSVDHGVNVSETIPTSLPARIKDVRSQWGGESRGEHIPPRDDKELAPLLLSPKMSPSHTEGTRNEVKERAVEEEKSVLIERGMEGDGEVAVVEVELGKNEGRLERLKVDFNQEEQRESKNSKSPGSHKFKKEPIKQSLSRFGSVSSKTLQRRRSKTVTVDCGDEMGSPRLQSRAATTMTITVRPGSQEISQSETHVLPKNEMKDVHLSLKGINMEEKGDWITGRKETTMNDRNTSQSHPDSYTDEGTESHKRKKSFSERSGADSVKDNVGRSRSTTHDSINENRQRVSWSVSIEGITRTREERFAVGARVGEILTGEDENGGVDKSVESGKDGVIEVGVMGGE